MKRLTPEVCECQYLSVMMLGLMVTRSVFVPTSVEYLSLIGGILHLKKTQDPVTGHFEDNA